MMLINKVDAQPQNLIVCNKKSFYEKSLISKFDFKQRSSLVFFDLSTKQKFDFDTINKPDKKLFFALLLLKQLIN